MTRKVAIALAAAIALLTACNGDSEDEAATTASTATTAAPATTAAGATTLATTATTAAPSGTSTTPTTALTAMNAVLEPDTVAGVPLGSNKAAAIAVLGPPTTTGQETDLSGARYDFLRWEFGGGVRGLVLNYRTPSVTSPLLTDWAATAAGPKTALNVTVGDTAATVTTAYGALQNFCCDSRVASVERGGGRLIVIVSNADQRVRQIIGGDPAFWSRSIAD